MENCCYARELPRDFLKALNLIVDDTFTQNGGGPGVGTTEWGCRPVVLIRFNGPSRVFDFTSSVGAGTGTSLRLLGAFLLGRFVLFLLLLLVLGLVMLVILERPEKLFFSLCEP